MPDPTDTAPPQDQPDPPALAAIVYGVVCPNGNINLTDPDARIAWHHAERANADCPCGTEPLRHVVRRMRQGRFGPVRDLPTLRGRGG